MSASAARIATPLKDVLGPLAYAAGAARVAATADPLRCSVTVDGDELFAGEAWEVILAITGAFGGGSKIASEPDDSEIVVMVITATPRPSLLRRGWGLRRGTLAGQPGVVHGRGVEVKVGLPPQAKMNVDGEVVAAGGPETVTLEPRAYSVVVG